MLRCISKALFLAFPVSCPPCSLPPKALCPSLSLSLSPAALGLGLRGSHLLSPDSGLQQDIRASGSELRVAPGSSLQPRAFLSFPLQAGAWIPPDQILGCGGEEGWKGRREQPVFLSAVWAPFEFYFGYFIFLT